MESIWQIICGVVTGTVLMTMFSHSLAFIANKEFEEPVLLDKLIARLPRVNESFFSRLGGWVIHCAIGVIFMILFHFVWQWTAIKPTIVSGAALGLGSGLIGICGWTGVFRLHPDPPDTDLKKHFMQLVIAHIIFGIGATIGYVLPYSSIVFY